MFAVVEGKLVVVISRFESMLRYSYINLLTAGCGGDVCPANDTACKTRHREGKGLSSCTALHCYIVNLYLYINIFLARIRAA